MSVAVMFFSALIFWYFRGIEIEMFFDRWALWGAPGRAVLPFEHRQSPRLKLQVACLTALLRHLRSVLHIREDWVCKTMRYELNKRLESEKSLTTLILFRTLFSCHFPFFGPPRGIP